MSLSRLLSIILGFFLLAGGFFVFTGTSEAAFLKQIHYQGRLYNSSGVLQGGSGTEFCFKFSIYEDATVGAPDTKLWPTGSPTGQSLNVQYGVFNYDLGSDATDGDLGSIDWQTKSDTAYLQIEAATKVGASCTDLDETYETLSPRQRVVSQANALNADKLQNASPGTGNSNILKLNSSGGIDLTGTTAGLSAAGANTLTLNASSTGNIQFFGSSYTLSNTGSLTIGSITGTGALTIAAGGSNTALVLNANGTGKVQLAAGSTGDIEFFNANNKISSSGNLTIAGGITAATSSTINGVNINSGAVSGVTTLGLTGAISGATSTNTINGLIVNSGALSGITTINASGQITSTLVTGTAPFVVASTTNVANLNASSLNGATFAAPGAIGGTTPGAATFTTLTAQTSITSGGTGTSALLQSPINETVGTEKAFILNHTGTAFGQNTDLLLELQEGGVAKFSVNRNGLITTASVDNSSVVSSAGIAYSKLNLATSVVGGDLATNIAISTTGNIATTGTGTITSAGLLTGSNGLTISSGTVTFPSASIADSALSTNVALKNATNTFTADQTIATATATDDTIILDPFTGGAARFAGSITTADLTAARTYTLPNESGTICTTGSICAGYQASGSYANTALSNLASVAINTALLPGANNTIDLGSGTLQFRTAYIGTSLILGTSGANSLTLSFTAPTAANTITFPNAGGTVAVSGTSPVTVSATGAISVGDATTAVKGIASFNSTNFTVSSGAVNTIQNINTGASPTFAGLTLAPATATDDTLVLTPFSGGVARFSGTQTTLDLTAARTYTFQNDSGIVPLSTAGNTVFFTTSGATALTLPTTGTVTAQGNTVTGSGSIVLATSPTITTPNISSIVNTGTLTLPTSNDTLVGRATTDILTNKTLRGAPVFDTATATDDTLTLSPFVGGAARFLGTITSADLTAARTYTLPDASGTFAVAGSNAIGLSAAGAISLTISGATADAATTSNSGLVITSTGVSLLRGCNPSQILKWTSPSWACADDNTGAGGSFIAKNAQDTSSASVAGILYDFTNTNTGASAQVLRLTNDGTSNALEVVQSANPASGKALIYANNSNVSPSGSLIDLRAGGASKFSVDAAGSVTIASSQSYLGAGALTLASGGTGTLTLRSSDQTAGSTNSANVTIKSGDASGLTSNSGNISIDAGTATGTKGTISVGGAQASALNLGRSGITTTIAGAVTLSAFGTAGVVHNDSTGALSSSLIVNADVDASAAIAYSKLNLATSIVGGDLATNITISTTGNIATTGTGTITSAGLLTGSNGLTISSGTVTLPSTSIADSALSTNVALLTGIQTFTGAKTFATATATDDSLSFTPFVGGAARFNGAITSLDLTAARTYTFQNDSGIVPLSTAGNTVFFTTSGTTTLTLPTTGTVTALGNTTTGSGSIVLATSPTISSPTLTGTVGLGTTGTGSVANTLIDNTVGTEVALVIDHTGTAFGQSADLLLDVREGGVSKFSVNKDGNVSGNQFTSTISTGTAPFVVSSTTNVANLNASSLNGATFANPGTIGGGTPGAATFTTLTAQTSITSGTTTVAGLLQAPIDNTAGTEKTFILNHTGTALVQAADRLFEVQEGGVAKFSVDKDGLVTTASINNTSVAVSAGIVYSKLNLTTSIVGGDLATNIAISTTGNIATTSTGTITSAGLLTGSNGLTISAGTVTLPSNSVADSALSTNVALLNAIQSFTAAKTFATATATDDTLTLSPFVGGAARFLGSITSADLTAARTYTLPDASGTFAVAGSSAIGLSTAGAISLTLSGNTADAATTSNSGLVVTSTGVSMLRGCGSGQILKWTSPSWACANDDTGAGGTFVNFDPAAAQTSSANSNAIFINRTALGSLLNLTQNTTLAAAYTGEDNLLKRNLVGGTNAQGGALVVLRDTSTGTGTINPTALLIDFATPTGATLFTGNYVDFKKADTAGSATVSKFSVSSAGNINAAGTISAATSSTINGVSINAGDISGGTGISSSGAITFSGLSTAGVVHNSAAGLLSTSLIVNADVDASAAIAYSKLNLATSIVGGDLAANITISTTGNIATTGTGTITSAGLLTASNGFTLTTGTLTLPSNSVADSALSTNVAFLTGTQVFTGAKTFATATSTDDSLSFTPFVGGAARFNGSITSVDLTAVRTYTFQNDSGIVPLSTAGNTVFFTTTGATALTLPTTGTVTAQGNTVTGSGAIVLQASPTLTGTVGLGATGANLTFSTLFNNTAGTDSALIVNHTGTAFAQAGDLLADFQEGGVSKVSISKDGQITSAATTGTAPFVVSSTTNVANLNASSLNGATFAEPGAIGGTTAGSGTFTTLAAQTSFTLGLSGTAGSFSIPFANTVGTDTGLVINHTGTAFAQAGDLLLDVQEGGVSKFSASKDGNIVAAGTINTNTFNSTALTFSGASPNISASTTNTSLTINSNGTGTITFASASTGNVGFYNVANNFITSAGALTIAGAATINGTGTSSIAGLTTLGSATLVSSTNLLQGTVDTTSSGNFLRFVNEATEKFRVDVNGAVVAASSLTTGVLTSANGSLVFNSSNAGSFATTINASASQTASYTLTLPTAQASGAQFLQNNGSGVLSWVTGGGSGCSTCLQQVPAADADNTVVPTADVTSLTLRQTSNGTPTKNIFAITNSANTVTYASLASDATWILNSAASKAFSLQQGGSNFLNISTAGALSISALGTNQSTTLNASGSGTVSIGGTSTGDILLAGGSSSTGCTVINLTGGLECNGGTANRNSIFNFLKSTSAVGADVALHSRAVKTAGANSTIPIGILGTTDATGGGFDHGVGVLGLAEPNASSLIGNGYYGVEGRVDNAKDSLTVASGVLGLGILAIDAPGGFTGSAGVEGKVELASGITGDATHVGIAGRFRVMLGAGTALGAGNYWNALLGDSTTNIRTTFRGGVNGGDGDADFTILDTIDKLHIDLKSPLTGVAFDLADAAGANTFIIRDSGDATVLSINSDGNVDAEGTLTAGISNAFSVNSSGEITAATSTNTINSLIINAGALSGITGYTQTSGTVSITSNSTSGNSLSLTNTTLNSNGSTLAGLSFTENLSATGTVNGLTLTPTLSGTAVANTYTTNVVNVANVAGTCPATATCVNNGLNLGTGLTNYIKAANFTVDAVAGNITAGTYNGVTLSTTSLNFGSAAPVIANSGANPIAIKSGNGLLTLNTASQANELQVFENAASPANYVSLKYTTVGLLSTNTGDLDLQAATRIVKVNTSGGANELRVYNGSNYASVTHNGTNAVFGGNTGAILGSGSGNVTISLLNSADIFQLDKTFTAAAAYSGSDSTFLRNITGGTNAITGNIFTVKDTTSTTGAGSNAGTALLVDMATPASSNLFTGTLLDLKRADTAGSATVSKFSVSALGALVSAGGLTTGGNLVFSAATPTISASTTNTTLAISANGSGTITLGASSTGDIQFYSSSNKITNAGALTIAAGATLGATPTLTNASGTLTISSAGALAISSGGTNTDVTVNAIGTGNIIVGGTVLGGVVRIGDATNNITFAATSRALTYNGTARPKRKVTLSPEYAGATLTGTGTGTMTSDFCEQGVHADIPDTNTTSCETGQIHNYYNWTTTSGTNQTYTVWIRWRVPDNFAAFDSTGDPIKVYGRRSDATNGLVTVFLYDTGGALENTSGTNVAGAANTWVTTSIEAAPYEGTYTAGSYMTIRIDMVADNTDNVKVGEIDIEYLSSN